jgi:hypothetical protein
LFCSWHKLLLSFQKSLNKTSQASVRPWQWVLFLALAARTAGALAAPHHHSAGDSSQVSVSL